MKKTLVILLALITAVLFIACTDKKGNEKSGESINVDEGLLFVDVTIPAAFFEDTTEAEIKEEAKEEGFDKIAYLFEAVAKIEKEHEERYRKLLANIEEDIVFQKGDEIVWVCRNCGHIHTGKTAPVKCPVCDHPQAYFEEKASNY